jgi:hypothetical protein
MSDTSIPEDDMTADGVDAPITEDTETSEPAKDQRRYAFLSRHISALRALRLGGVFTVAAAIVLAIVWWVQLALLLGVAFPYFLFTLAILFLWFVGARLRPLKRTFAALTAVCIVIAVGVMGQRWWLIHEQTSIWIGLPPVQALVTFGLGVFVASDVALRGIRDHQNTPPGDPSDPARYRPMKHNNITTSSRRWAGLLRRIALTVAPVTAAATAIALLQASAAPINQTAPLPEGPLPERSTGIGATVSWTKDVTGLLATASGAAGPVILTIDGLTGLNPTDGTTLWTYQRTSAAYAKILGPTESQESFGSLSSSYLVSSPNGRYVALRIKFPDELAQIHAKFITNVIGKDIPTRNAVTIVVDTLTGHVTNEHPSNINWNLQLTDSALLDGTTAYNLDDGKVRWNLKAFTDDKSRPYSPSGYSGPAGHRSFILSGQFTGYKAEEHMSRSLTLMSDTDPTDTTTVENIAVDILTRYPVIVNGTTAQYTKALVVEREKGETPRAIQAQETRVVTLDSLAGLEEMKPINMGKTAGLNAAASHASGTLAAYPIPEDGKIKILKYDTVVEHLEWGNPTVGTVYDPTTHTATPANQYPGLAATAVGITPTTQGETLSAKIVMKPADGSTGTSVALDTRTIFQTISMDEPNQILEKRARKAAVNIINVPGATFTTLRVDDGLPVDSDWYSSYSPFTSTGYEYAPSYRLYGLTGDAS